METQVPSICRMVVYNHPGSADGKYLPMQSPAVIQKVNPSIQDGGIGDGESETVNLFVMSVSGGIFFAKNVPQGDGPSEWNFPART